MPLLIKLIENRSVTLMCLLGTEYQTLNLSEAIHNSDILAHIIIERHYNDIQWYLCKQGSKSVIRGDLIFNFSGDPTLKTAKNFSVT